MLSIQRGGVGWGGECFQTEWVPFHMGTFLGDALAASSLFT